jgi:hypothetical protein
MPSQKIHYFKLDLFDNVQCIIPFYALLARTLFKNLPCQNNVLPNGGDLITIIIYTEGWNGAEKFLLSRTIERMLKRI